MALLSTRGYRIHELRLRRATLATLLLLLVQFGLGIATNLYATIPAHHPGSHPASYLSGSVRSVGWALAHGTTVLAAHAAFGIFLALVALGLVVQALRARRGGLAAVATLALAAVVGAGFSGASFLDYRHNANSLVMALLFAFAAVLYALMIYVE